jgi:hypothetical protein
VFRKEGKVILWFLNARQRWRGDEHEAKNLHKTILSYEEVFQPLRWRVSALPLSSVVSMSAIVIFDAVSLI